MRMAETLRFSWRKPKTLRRREIMSDDLVKLARHNANADIPHHASVSLIEEMADRIEELEAKLKEAMIGVPLTAEQVDALGLVTMILDDIDWDDELEAKLKEAMALVGIIF
jgi:hypothetical protein